MGMGDGFVIFFLFVYMFLSDLEKFLSRISLPRSESGKHNCHVA